MVQHSANAKDLSYAALPNLYFLEGNANILLKPLLDSLNHLQGRLQRVTMFFPDPWYKEKHRKRRILTDDLVRVLHDFISEDGELYIESDHVVGINSCREIIERHGGWKEMNATHHPLKWQSEWGKKMANKRLTDSSIVIGALWYTKRR